MLTTPSQGCQPLGTKKCPIFREKMPQMGFLLHKGFQKNAWYIKMGHFFHVLLHFYSQRKMPHVSKNANFSEKGIKNARLATLPSLYIVCNSTPQPAALPKGRTLPQYELYLPPNSINSVGNLTGLENSVGKLPGLCVGTLQVSWKTGISRNFAYTTPRHKN